MKRIKKDFKDVEIAESAIIDDNVKFVGVCKIGKNSLIGQGSVIIGSVIGEDCQIFSSYIENSQIGNGVIIGPYAHIRPNTIIEDKVKIGNFVEVKNSHLKSRTKIPHHAYIGDAQIGENCNISCGVIFANYNGKIKQKIVVGNNVFIGCNSNLIAPLNISENSYICAGTTLTQNTKPNDFVIGRCREIIKNNKAKEYLNKEE